MISTDIAYLQGQTLTLSSHHTGRIDKLLVRPGDTIANDTPLAILCTASDTHTCEASQTPVRAPVAGQLHQWTISAGEGVSPGMPLLIMVPQQTLWITAYFKETELPQLRPQTRVSIQLDAYPDKVYTGHISALSGLAGASLSPGTPNYSAGNFTRIVQRIPVTIQFDTYPDQHLAIGLSAKVKVSTR